MLEFQNEKWQRDYMRKLADFVIKMADTCETVPEWLTQNPHHKPKSLLGASVAQEEEADQPEEESKE